LELVKDEEQVEEMEQIVDAYIIFEN